MGADGGIGNDAFGGPLSGFVAQLSRIEAGQNDRLSGVPFRTVPSGPAGKTWTCGPPCEIIKPDNLSLVGACQEHKAIARLRGVLRHPFSLAHLRRAPRRPARRQRWRKNRSNRDVVASTPIVARCILRRPPLGFLLRTHFWFGVGSIPSRLAFSNAGDEASDTMAISSLSWM
jgi:hypothetical protein